MDITRGSLDEITRPASSERWRPGSRVSLTNASFSVRNTPTPLQSSLEILPDDHTFEDEDLEVEEYISPREELNNLEEDACEIQSELNHNGNHNTVVDDQPEGNDGHNEKENDGSDLMDPQLKEAIEKMRKLDRILAKKVAREQDVKRERLLLEQRLREELERAKPEGRDEAKETAENTIKFLALKPPPKHYEGILTEEEEVCFSPLFATQPIDLKDGKSQCSSDGASEDTNTARSASTSTYSTNTGSRQTSGRNKKINSKNKKAKKTTKKNGTDTKDETDFIQRNIQLASDASNAIAMTDDEKRRLEDLLADVEMLGDDNKQIDENLHTLQLHSVPGIGYHPDQNDIQTLKEIDDKLKELMPAEDFESICSTPREINIHPSIPLTRISDLRESLDVMELGEKVLQENQDTRNQQEKLKLIEKELEKLQNRVEMEIVSPSMSKAQLSELYDEFTDVSSRATSETNSIALSSPRTPRGSVPPSASTMDPTSPRTVSQSSSVSLATSTPQGDDQPVPALPDDVLRQLLEEAKIEMMSGNRSRLSTVQEESEPEYSTISRQSWDCMTNRNARVIMPSLPGSIIRDLINNPRVTSHSLSSSRANSSLSIPSNGSMSTQRESLSVTSSYSNTESLYNGSTPDSRLHHTDNGKLADSSPRHATSGDAPSCDTSTRAINKMDVGSNYTTIQKDGETPSLMVNDNTFGVRQKTPCHSNTDHLLNGDDRSPCPATDEKSSRSSNGKDSGSVLNRRNTKSVSDENRRRSPRDARHLAKSSNGRHRTPMLNERDLPKEQDRTPNGRDITPDGRGLTPDGRGLTPGERGLTPGETGLTQDGKSFKSNSNRNDQKLQEILHASSTNAKPQAMFSRTDPEASASRAASTTSTFRSDSQASTNTVISSSDFEYENQEGMKDEFLSKESPANGLPVPTPPKSGVASRTRLRRDVSLNIDDSENDDDDKGGTFSPPFF